MDSSTLRLFDSDERERRSAFTLIEMLVVVVIIGILAGIVFKLIGAGGASSDRAKTRRQLEQLANAIEEYRAEYGEYPRVAKNKNGEQPLRYEYPNKPSSWTGSGNAKPLANRLATTPRTEATVFVFGLMSYLECRVEGRAENTYESLLNNSGGLPKSQHHWQSENDWIKKDSANIYGNHAADSPRKKRFARRVEPYLKEIRGTWHEAPHWTDESTKTGDSWTNCYDSVWDAWDQQLKYHSDPPYDSYRIWSIGPDGKDGTADDLVAGTEN